MWEDKKGSAFLNSSHDYFNPAIAIWHHSNTNEVSFGGEDLRYMSYSLIVSHITLERP